MRLRDIPGWSPPTWNSPPPKIEDLERKGYMTGWTLSRGRDTTDREHIVITVRHEGREYRGALPPFGIVMNRRVLMTLKLHLGMWMKDLEDLEVVSGS